MTDEAIIEHVARAICCIPNGCRAPEYCDHLKGIVGICHAKSYEKEARAAIAAYEAVLKNAGMDKP